MSAALWVCLAVVAQGAAAASASPGVVSDAGGAPPDASLPADAAKGPASPESPDGASAVDTLEARLAAMEAELTQTRAQLAIEAERRDAAERSAVRLTGYVDVGFFTVQGNGSGVRKDIARDFPQYRDVLATWVLVGDPLGPTVNARGDVADLGDSRALRFDPIHSQGRPTFLVNAVNLNLAASLGEAFSVHALVDLLPRFRDVSDPQGLFAGDYLEVKVAWAKYRRRFGWGGLTVFAGKNDSLLGLEYRTQEAPSRLTVTPSFICRYTCGRPVGLTALATLLRNRVELAAAVTNGSNQVEGFPFSNEVDRNRFKTLTGRAALRLPVGKKLELNVSGALGPQDRQPDDSVLQWHLGAAALFEWDEWHLSAEFVTGRADGRAALVSGAEVPCAAAACLQYRGAYGQVGFFGWPVVAPYLRVDWREATMREGRSWVYVSNALRATAGLNARLHAQVLLKAEYSVNRQLLMSADPARGSLEFPDDVFTSAVVVSF